MAHQHHNSSSHQHSPENQSCPSCHVQKKFDWLLWGSLGLVTLGYGAQLFFTEQIQSIPFLPDFTQAVQELINKMWWGLALGILFVGFLAKLPQKYIMSVLGKPGTLGGILRATAGGILLDLCSHGILVVGMQLYKRGASLGQMMAFLIASPWNSLSLTLILWALVGFKWMITLLLLSMVIAIISGIIFDILVRKKILPQNPNHFELPQDFRFWKEAKSDWKSFSWSGKFTKELGQTAWHESRMILRWIFLGVVLAGLLRTFLTPEMFQQFFGPTLAGLGMTVIIATILEVCSEGSTPIAADILNRAGAPGNAFAFLMTGVSTDYTEIMSLKETTKSWKISFFLPLVTVPQVILISWLLNLFAA
ncbi:permease [Candidatus Gracilibacteria bacterium]|nr:permease [Candidatus Gracilibacteria bacterium]MCF7819563.1 permease [Candidatus Gracilibacteria bacterium]